MLYSNDFTSSIVLDSVVSHLNMRGSIVMLGILSDGNTGLIVFINS